MGGNYHFSRSPRSLYRPIFYGTLGAGNGQSEDSVDPSENGKLKTLNGDAFFYHAGLGVKYYTGRWGGKAQLDYYQRTETYVSEDLDDTGATVEKEEVRTLSGPRLLLGLLYRF